MRYSYKTNDLKFIKEMFSENTVIVILSNTYCMFKLFTLAEKANRAGSYISKSTFEDISVKGMEEVFNYYNENEKFSLYKNNHEDIFINWENFNRPDFYEFLLFDHDFSKANLGNRGINNYIFRLRNQNLVTLFEISDPTMLEPFLSKCPVVVLQKFFEMYDKEKQEIEAKAKAIQEIENNISSELRLLKEIL